VKQIQVDIYLNVLLKTACGETAGRFFMNVVYLCKMDIKITLFRFLLLIPFVTAYGCSLADQELPVLNTNSSTMYETQADSLYFYRKLTGNVQGREIIMDITRDGYEIYALYQFYGDPALIRFNGSSTIDDDGNLRFVRYNDDIPDTLVEVESFTASWNPQTQVLSGIWKANDVEEMVVLRAVENNSFNTIRLAHVDTTVGDCEYATCLTINLTWPEIIGWDSQSQIGQNILSYVSTSPHFMDASINSESVDSFIVGMIRGYRSAYEDSDNMLTGWSRDLTTHIRHNKNGIVGIELDDYAYLGGAHPNGMTIYLVYDTEYGTRLGLDHILQPESFTALESLALASLYAKYDIPTGGSLSDAGFFVDDANPFLLTENFMVDGNGMSFTFNPYEIAPYVMGPISINLAWAEVEHLIQPEFLERIRK